MITASCGDIVVEQAKARYSVSRCVLTVCQNHVTGVPIVCLQIKVRSTKHAIFVSITDVKFASRNSRQLLKYDKNG